MPRTNTKLSAKESIFIDEYLIDKNGSRAARAAGYSEANARATAHLMLKKPRIQTAIQAALDEQKKRTLIEADQVLKDIERIAGKAEAAGEFNAALKGKELLGKHYKLFTEKHEHGGIGGGPLVMQVTQTDEKL
jgi:phage terminase small subunit